MDWGNERYIRWYTRNTPEWCVLPWQTRGLWGLILRELNRAGILELGKLGVVEAIAVAVRADKEEIAPHVQRLLDDGCLIHRDDLRLVVAPNFVEAQEATQSDKSRAKSSRERARDIALAKARGLDVTARVPMGPVSRNVTAPSQSVTHASRNVMPPSRNVTPTSRPHRSTVENDRGGQNGVSSANELEPLDEGIPDDLGEAEVTNRDADVTKRDGLSRNVTKTFGNAVSRHSTPSYAKPSRAEPFANGASAPPESFETPIKKPASAAAAASGFRGNVTATSIEAEIRKHRVFSALDARTIAESHAGRMMTDTQRLPDVLESIEKCARKVEGLGLLPPALQSRLVGYLWNAGKLGGGRAPALAEPAAPPEDFDFSQYEGLQTGGRRSR